MRHFFSGALRLPTIRERRTHYERGFEIQHCRLYCEYLKSISRGFAVSARR